MRQIISSVMFICIALCTMSRVAVAQSYTPVKNTEEFKRLFAARSSAITSIQSDFTQQKSISMLENKIISEGTFTYKRENRLRMEYSKPYKFLFVMDHDQITIGNNQQKSSVSANSNKMYKLISQLTLDCFTGNVLNSKDFDLTISENARVYKLVLIPRQKLLKSLFERIDILISKIDVAVDKIELAETSGDHTTLIFHNKVINNPVNDEVFKIH
jgi:outer membrane lipoprotein-sorting protein